MLKSPLSRLPLCLSAGERGRTHLQEVAGCDYLNVLVIPKSQEVAVASDNELRMSKRGAFDNRIIIWIGQHHFQSASDGNDFGEDANFFRDLAYPLGVQVAFELKLLGKFSKDGFAR